MPRMEIVLACLFAGLENGIYCLPTSKEMAPGLSMPAFRLAASLHFKELYYNQNQE